MGVVVAPLQGVPYRFHRATVRGRGGDSMSRYGWPGGRGRRMKIWFLFAALFCFVCASAQAAPGDGRKGSAPAPSWSPPPSPFSIAAPSTGEVDEAPVDIQPARR